MSILTTARMVANDTYAYTRVLVVSAVLLALPLLLTYLALSHANDLFYWFATLADAPDAERLEFNDPQSARLGAAAFGGVCGLLLSLWLANEFLRPALADIGYVVRQVDDGVALFTRRAITPAMLDLLRDRADALWGAGNSIERPDLVQKHRAARAIGPRRQERDA